MIVLYDKNKTSGFDRNDLVLQNVTKNVVAWEKNGQYKIDLVYAIDTDDMIWKSIVKGAIIKCPVAYQQDQLFRLNTPTKKFDSGCFSIEVTGLHISYDLSDNLLEDVRPTGLTGIEAGKYLLAKTQFSNPFTWIGDITDINTAYYIRQNVINSLIGSEDQDYVNRWGGELVRDNFNIGMMKQAGKNRGTVIKYSKNLLGFEQSADDTSLVTRAMPTISDDSSTSTSTDSMTPVIMIPEKYVDSPRINDYAHPYIKEIQVTLTDAQKSLSISEQYKIMRDYVNAQYAKNIDVPVYSYTVNFVNLAKTEEYEDYAILEEVHPYDFITVKALDIDVIAELVGYTYDSLVKNYEGITLGNIQNDILRSNKKSLFQLGKTNNQNIKILQAQMSDIPDNMRTIANNSTSGGNNLFDHAVNTDTNILEWTNSGASCVIDDSLHSTSKIWELPHGTSISKNSVILNPNNFNGQQMTLSLQAKYNGIIPNVYNNLQTTNVLLGSLDLSYKANLANNTNNWVVNDAQTGVISAEYIGVNAGDSFIVNNPNSYVFVLHGYDKRNNFIIDFTDKTIIPNGVIYMKVEIIKTGLTPESLLSFTIYLTQVQKINNFVTLYATGSDSDWGQQAQTFTLETGNTSDILTQVDFKSANNDATGTAYIGAFMINTGTVTSDFSQSSNDTVETLHAHQIVTDYISAKVADIDQLHAVIGTIDTFSSTYATIATLKSDYATITNLNANFATIDNLTANYATIANLTAVSGTIDNLSSTYATITNLNATNVTAQNLSANVAKVIDLTAGTLKAGSVNAGSIKAGSITADSAIIANGAITNAMIGKEAVGTSQIADGSVTDLKVIDLSANSITSGTIDATKITVTNLNCANLTVGTINGTQIAPGAVTATNLAKAVNDLITGANTTATTALNSANGKNKNYYGTTAPTGTFVIGDLWFDTSKGNRISQWNGTTWGLTQFGSLAISALDAGSITTGILNAANVTITNLSANSITGGSINAAVVSVTNLKADNITSGSLSADRLAAGTITGDKLVVDAITAREIAAKCITANELLANTITAGEIKAGTITATEIHAGTITANEIKANTITVDQLASSVGSGLDISSNTSITMRVTSTTYSAGIAGAINTASTDASNKASSAQSSAIASSKTYTDGQITVANNAINLKVSTTTYNAGLTSTLNTASSDASTKANNAQASAISSASGDATSKASGAVASAKTYTDGQITVTNKSIALKVSSTDYNGNNLVSMINQSASKISMSALNIDLSGYATFTNLKTAGSTTINGANIMTGSISATSINTTNLTAQKITTTGSSVYGIIGSWTSGSYTATGLKLCNTSNVDLFRVASGNIGTDGMPATFIDVNGALTIQSSIGTTNGASLMLFDQLNISTRKSGGIDALLMLDQESFSVAFNDYNTGIQQWSYILKADKAHIHGQGYIVHGAPNDGGSVFGVGQFDIVTGSNPWLRMYLGSDTSRQFGATVWASDISLKKDIHTSTVNATDRLNQINCSSFTWRCDDKYQALGVIAQDLQRVEDSWVIKLPQEDGTVQMQPNAGTLIPYLIKSNQELSEECRRLNSKILASESRISALESRASIV